jgi:hypothetical protein
MNTLPPSEQEMDAALEPLSRDEMSALIKRMIELYPSLAYLLVPTQPAAQKRKWVPFNAEFYRKQVEEIFYTTDRDSWGSEAAAAEPLLDIVEIGDDYVQQQNFGDAAKLYEIIVREILDNYDSFRWHAEEGDLDDVVKVCVEGLGKCLRGMPDDAATRKQILLLLFDVYDFDSNLENDMPVMSEKVPALLVRYTTPEERHMIAGWVREAFELEIDWSAEDVSEYYDDLLLGLEADTIDDETFLRICRETENYNYLIERLLKRGKLDEALAEAVHVDTYDILEIADILCEYGQGAAAEHLIEERAKQSDNANLLQWLQERYQAAGNITGALDMAIRTFQAYPLSGTIESYREIRQLAQQLDRWETVRSELLAYLQKSRHIELQIEIALDEGQIKQALDLLFAEKQTGNRSNGPFGGNTFDVGIEVAQAAEGNYPQEAIEIYQAYVETLIEWRGRERYQVACQYLISVRKLYQKMGKNELWSEYIAKLREQNRNLPALKDELAKAKL